MTRIALTFLVLSLVLNGGTRPLVSASDIAVQA